MADVKTYISADYIPTAEDFVPVSIDSMSRASVREAASPKAEVLKRFISQRSAVAGAAFLTLLILLALIGPYISGHRFDDQNLGHTNLAPRVPVLSSLGILDGSEKMFKTGGTEVVNRYEEQGITDVYYLFGTDSLGRDMFARTFMGLRISLLIAFIAYDRCHRQHPDTGRCHAPHDRIKARNRFHYFRPDALRMDRDEPHCQSRGA